MGVCVIAVHSLDFSGLFNIFYFFHSLIVYEIFFNTYYMLSTVLGSGLGIATELEESQLSGRWMVMS